tara:strand:- start:144 stop:1139 length:996 start_codon:yes stop_codon:yes gene_type:complete
MKIFPVYFLFFFIYSCQTSNTLQDPIFSDFLSERVLSDDLHSAFPDAVLCRGDKLVSYRAGLTHASDKGTIKIINLKSQESIEIKDELYDLRNGYFLLEDDDLFLYCSVYNHDTEKFITLFKYEIILQKNILAYKFIGNEDFHQVYHPFSNKLGAWSIKKGDNWFVFPEKKDSLFLDDEEVSFIKFNNKLLGVGRNHKKAGLPLVIFSKDTVNWVAKDWCYEKKDVALVSPKLYEHKDEIVLAYSERKVDYLVNFYRLKIINYEQTVTQIKFYKSYADLVSCNAHNTKTIYSGNSIDAGYPALIFANDKIFVYTYEKENLKTSIIERVLEY